MADRFGRRRVIQFGFVGAFIFLVLFAQTSDRNLALALLVPLSLCIFMPTSVLVVLGQEYLPQRVGMASGVTLGLAVSVGGMSAPLLGRLGQRYGLSTVLLLLLAFLLVAAGQAFALPRVAGSDPIATEPQPEPVTSDRPGH
jgi:MFS transporter, FSR family, fosmidomycin resistance protein